MNRCDLHNAVLLSNQGVDPDRAVSPQHGIVTNVSRCEYPAHSTLPTQEGIKKDDITTENLLNEAGYATHHYGKFHLTEDHLSYLPDMYGEGHEYAHDLASTFHEVRKQPRATWMNWYGWAMPVTVAPPLRRAVEAMGDRWKGHRHAEFVTKMGRLDLPLEKTFEARIADRTVVRLDSLESQPFMVTCSFNLPHDPNVVPSPYYESFSPDQINFPSNYGRFETRFENDFSRRIVADLGESGAREFLRIYYASVRLVDDKIGRVPDSLERTGRARDTIVVLTTDHGDMADGHSMVWKSTSDFYDEIVRIPLIVRYPRRIKPQKTDLAASHVDIMPTLWIYWSARFLSQFKVRVSPRIFSTNWTLRRHDPTRLRNVFRRTRKRRGRFIRERPVVLQSGAEAGSTFVILTESNSCTI